MLINSILVKFNTLVMKNLNPKRKIKLKKTYSNHRGSLIEGEKVTLISVNEQKQEGKVEDPFGVEWYIPLEFLEIS